MIPTDRGTHHSRAAHGGWNPATPLAIALAATLIAFAPWRALPGGIAIPALLAVGLVLLVVAEPGSRRRWLGVILAGWLPLAISLLIVHGLFFPEGERVLWAMGPLRATRDGLDYGVFLAVRYGLIFSGVGVALGLASVDGLARVLEGATGRRRWIHPVRAALGLLPAARRRAMAIRQAQRARGLRSDTPWRRVRAVAPLIVPLAASLLSDADTRAATLATRGFDSGQRPTSLVRLPDAPWQRWVRIAAPAIALIVLVATHVWVRLPGAAGVGP